MIKVEVVRKIKSYTLGIGGIGTVDWEILLECGHKVRKTTESLTVGSPFQIELECTDCEKMSTRELEQFHVVEDGIYPEKEKQTSKTRTY